MIRQIKEDLLTKRQETEKYLTRINDFLTEWVFSKS